MLNLYEKFNAIKKLFDKETAPIEAKYGLTNIEFNILMFLADNKNVDSASDIVECRQMTKSHVSVSVRSLIDRGLLVGEHCEDDRRTIHLILCPAADEIIKEGHKAQKKVFSALLEGFSEDDKRTFGEYLAKIDDNISNIRGGN